MLPYIGWICQFFGGFTKKVKSNVINQSRIMRSEYNWLWQVHLVNIWKGCSNVPLLTTAQTSLKNYNNPPHSIPQRHASSWHTVQVFRIIPLKLELIINLFSLPSDELMKSGWGVGVRVGVWIGLWVSDQWTVLSVQSPWGHQMFISLSSAWSKHCVHVGL